jgi:hypothetical protein
MYRLAGLAWRSPAGFGGLACLLYAILLLPGLALHRFDVSALIMAGDRFVDARQVESPILVHRESNGYDGQFYYRMALAPLSLAPVTGGVRFDHPAWRMQRIFYPVCAWLLAFGRAAAAPWSLLAVNLLGMAAIGWFGRALAVRAGLAGWVPIAILLWPGFIVALTHDTTEILSEALVLAALVCRLRRQAVGCALLGVLAVLTREMTLLTFAGLLLWDARQSWLQRRMLPELAAGLAIPVPALIWHLFLASAWVTTPQDHMAVHNLGMPLFGIIDMLIACVTGARLWASSWAKDLVVRGIVLTTAPALLAFCGLVASRVGAVLRGPSVLAPLALSWCLLAGLMSLMTDEGPWIDPAAYFRAFTECYVTGCLVLGCAGGLRAVTPRWALAGGAIFATVWIYCLVQLRVS